MEIEKTYQVVNKMVNDPRLKFRKLMSQRFGGQIWGSNWGADCYEFGDVDVDVHKYRKKTEVVITADNEEEIKKLKSKLEKEIKEFGLKLVA